MSHFNRTRIIGETFKTRQSVLPIVCAFVVCMSPFVFVFSENGLLFKVNVLFSHWHFFAHKGLIYCTLKNGRFLPKHHNIYIGIKLLFKTELQDVFSGLRLGSHFVVPSLGVTIKVISNSKFFQMDDSRRASVCI